MKNKEESTEFERELMDLLKKHLERANNISLVNPKEGDDLSIGIIGSCLALTVAMTAQISIKLGSPKLFNDLPRAFNYSFKAVKKLYQKDKSELDKLNQEG